MWGLDILDIYKPLLQAHWTLDYLSEILNFTTANTLGLVELFFCVSKMDYYVYRFSQSVLISC